MMLTKVNREKVIEVVTDSGWMLGKASRKNRAEEMTCGDTADRETSKDIESLKIICAGIRKYCPEDGFMGEGLLQHSERLGLELNDRGFYPGSSGLVWVCDPICGTTAFANTIPQFIVSLGLVTDTNPVEFIAGIIYHPALERLYYAEQGFGSWIFSREYPAGKQLHVRAPVRDIADLKNKVIMSTGQGVIRSGKYGPGAIALSQHFGELLVDASCGLPMAYVAEGSYGLAVKQNQPFYDFAAGVCLVQEAGGLWLDHTGNQIKPQSLSRSFRTHFVATSDDPLIVNLVKEEIAGW